MIPRLIRYNDAVSSLTWHGAVDALRDGHLRPKAQFSDLMVGNADTRLLNRAAAIEGLGFAVKAETIFSKNAARGLPSVQGAVLLFDAVTGSIKAVIESRLITQFKTVGDSLLGAQFLARPDSRHLVIVGAGVLAASLARGYASLFPKLERISIWARRPQQAEALALALTDISLPITAVPDLEKTVSDANIISTATMAKAPVIFGDWIAPGTHVDLIGAFTPEMRESDDKLIAKARVFVDCKESTVDRTGDLMGPLTSGAIGPDHILGDLYDLVSLGNKGRQNNTDITVYKNGGGAHLDLMIASYVANITFPTVI